MDKRTMKRRRQSAQRAKVDNVARLLVVWMDAGTPRHGSVAYELRQVLLSIPAGHRARVCRRVLGTDGEGNTLYPSVLDGDVDRAVRPPKPLVSFYPVTCAEPTTDEGYTLDYV